MAPQYDAYGLPIDDISNAEAVVPASPLLRRTSLPLVVKPRQYIVYLAIRLGVAASVGRPYTSRFLRVWMRARKKRGQQ